MRVDALGERDRLGESATAVPIAVLEQHPAVVGTTLRVEERAAVPIDEPLQGLDPLGGALDVEAAAARDHRHATRLRDRERFAFAGDRTDHHLVEQLHALVGATLLHQCVADRRHGQELQIGVAVGPSDVECAASEALALARVLGDVRRGPQELPSHLRDLVLDDPSTLGEPPPSGRQVAVELLVVAHQRQRRGGRHHRLRSLTEPQVGLLAVGDRPGGVTQPEQGQRQPEPRLGDIVDLDHRGEPSACPDPVPCRHRLERRFHLMVGAVRHGRAS